MNNTWWCYRTKKEKNNSLNNVIGSMSNRECSYSNFRQGFQANDRQPNELTEYENSSSAAFWAVAFHVCTDVLSVRYAMHTMHKSQCDQNRQKWFYFHSFSVVLSLISCMFTCFAMFVYQNAKNRFNSPVRSPGMSAFVRCQCLDSYYLSIMCLCTFLFGRKHFPYCT